MPTRAGDIDQRVTIQRRTTERDVAGGYTHTYNDWATRWASIRPLSGGESVEARQGKARVRWEVRLRYTAAISPTDRIVLGDGRTLNIEAVLRSSRRYDETVVSAIEEVG